MRSTTCRALLAVLVIQLVACAHFKQAADISLEELKAPTQWTGTEQMPLDWRQWIQSDQLDTLLLSALANNHDLKATYYRWQAAKHQLSVNNGARWPGIDLTLNQQKQKFDKSITTQANGGIGIAWEVDLWGRVAASADISQYAYMAQGEGLKWARWSLAAAVVQSWLGAIESKQQA